MLRKHILISINSLDVIFKNIKIILKTNEL